MRIILTASVIKIYPGTFLAGVFDEAILSTFAHCSDLGIFTQVEWIAASLEDSLLAMTAAVFPVISKLGRGALLRDRNGRGPLHRCRKAVETELDPTIVEFPPPLLCCGRKIAKESSFAIAHSTKPRKSKEPCG